MAPVFQTKTHVPSIRRVMVVKLKARTTCVFVILVHQGACSRGSDSIVGDMFMGSEESLKRSSPKGDAPELAALAKGEAAPPDVLTARTKTYSRRLKSTNIPDESSRKNEFTLYYKSKHSSEQSIQNSFYTAAKI